MKFNKLLNQRKIPSAERQHIYERKSPFSKDCDFCRRLEDILKVYKEKLADFDNEAETNALRDKINQLLKGRGIEIERKDYKPISESIHRILRIHFNGGIENPPAEKLSPAFRCGSGRASPEDYDLKASKVWRFMYRFEEFRGQENLVRKALASAKVAPELVGQLNTFDFEAAVFQYRRRYDPRAAEQRGNYMELFEGSKRSFIKVFAANHGNEFKKMLDKMGVDRAYSEQLLKVMSEKGLMPPVIRGENGQALQGPLFTVHHKTALQDAGQFDDYTQVNKFNNFCIMLDSPEKDKAAMDLPPLHKMAHSTDKPVYYEQEKIDEAGNAQKVRRIRFIERLKLPEKVCFMAGLSVEFQIQYTEKDRADYAQRREQAGKNVSKRPQIKENHARVN